MQRLPEAFSSSLGNQLPDACHLKVPSGETHQVALVKENDNLWFQDGWEEFVNCYSIGYGHFLLFSYYGNSTFGVKIYDTCASQICYDQCDKGIGSPMQTGHSHDDLNPKLSDEIQSDDGVGIRNIVNDNHLDDDVNLKNVRSQSMKKRKARVEVVELDSADDETMPDETGGTIGDEVIGTKVAQRGAELPVWLMKYKEELKVIAASGVSMPTNPFFVALIRPSHMALSGYLYLPIEFARRYLKWKDGDCFKVVNRSQGEHWLMRCRKSRASCCLGTGWVEFARDVCLKVGDVCIFEVTDAENLVLNVCIFKSS